MDPEIRDLERLASQGDRSAAVGALAARVRTGAVSLAGLELAAYLGDDAARAVLRPSVLARGPRFGGWAAGELTEDELAWSDLNLWILGLERWGVPTLVRALVALSRIAADELLRTYASLTSVHRALDATLAWCDAPGDDTANALDAAQEEAASRWLALDPLHFDAQGRPTRVSLLNQEALEAAEVASMAAGRDGHRFTQGARDPRAKVRPPRSLLSPSAAEALLRGALLPVAFDARSLDASLADGREREPRASEVGAAALRAERRSERAELAAYLGHTPARRLLGASVLCRSPGRAGWGRAGSLSEEELSRSHDTWWVDGLELWGVPWLVRGSCAIAAAVITSDERAAPSDAAARRALAAAEAWCRAPGSSTLAGAARAETECLTRLGELDASDGRPSETARRHREQVMNAARAVQAIVDASRGHRSRYGTATADPRWRRSSSYGVHSLGARGVDVVSVVRDALLPVVLGPEPA